ncbi:MAG: 30S ribosomal protein S8 [Deltaproteobacteria bacterium]
MAMTDPIADMLTRIRNAVKSRHEKLDVPVSRIKLNILKILKDEGYIQNYRIVKEAGKDVIRIALKYVDGKNVILGIKRISKPGRRIYCSKDRIPRIRAGYGISIITTSRGLMTDSQARENGLGGEVLLAVW